jgi:hypothetical protein
MEVGGPHDRSLSDEELEAFERMCRIVGLEIVRCSPEAAYAAVDRLVQQLRKRGRAVTVLDTPLGEVFGDSPRVANALESVGCYVLGDVLNAPDEHLRRAENIGPRALVEIRKRQLTFVVERCLAQEEELGQLRALR